MKSLFNRLPRKSMIVRAGRFLAVTVLVFSLLLAALNLTPPAPMLAQDPCQDIRELMTYDYRGWGIGKFRNCGCDWDDLGCIANIPICLAKKGEEIAAGGAVAQWIIASRNSAAGRGVSRIPDAVRRKLDTLYPASILDKAYYSTESGALGTLQWFREEMGKHGAITLVDIIVFADAERAKTDVKLWAHELEHVRQYDQLGIDGFAQAYAAQTCILPGALGYDSGRCQVEWMAKRKSEYFNREGFISCCAFPSTVVLRDRVVTGAESYTARDMITVGPNLVIQGGGNVTLRAGRVITMQPGIRTAPGGTLFASVDPEINQTCVMP